MTDSVALPELVLADMLCAAADNDGIALSRRDATRLAHGALELLAIAGWALERVPPADDEPLRPEVR